MTSSTASTWIFCSRVPRLAREWPFTSVSVTLAPPPPFCLRHSGPSPSLLCLSLWPLPLPSVSITLAPPPPFRLRHSGPSPSLLYLSLWPLPLSSVSVTLAPPPPMYIPPTRSFTTPVGSDMMSPGLTQDGIKCGEDQVGPLFLTRWLQFTASPPSSLPL